MTLLEFGMFHKILVESLKLPEALPEHKEEYREIPVAEYNNRRYFDLLVEGDH